MITKDLEVPYLNLLEEILTYGSRAQNRTGIDTLALFGQQMRFRIDQNFPLLTTKKMFWRGIVEELLWVLRGETNSKTLEQKGVNIWQPNSTREFLDKQGLPYTEGELGPVYGFQLRSFNANYIRDERENVGVDQLSELIEGLKNNPQSRRHLITLWNPCQISEMALPPCHGCIVQFFVHDAKYLSCFMHQRSCDTFLGVPFNIASYSLLTYIIAQTVNLVPYEFIHSLGDAHIYENHIDAVKEQLNRDPLDPPKVYIDKDLNNVSDIEGLTIEDIELEGYNYHPGIKASMAV